MAATATTQRTGTPAARRVVLPPAAALAAAVVTCVVALFAGGAASAASTGLGDPGALVRWALPTFRVAHDLSAATTIGAFVLAALALPRTSRAFPAALRVGALAATVWAIAALGVLVLTYSDVAGRPLGDPGFGAELGLFVQQIDLGRALVATVVVAGLVATAAFGVASMTGAALLALAAVLGVLPLSLAGHAAGASSHETAVTSLAMHLVGVSVWVGGLLTLLLVASGLGRDAAVVVSRFSTLALVSYAAVGASGLINGWVRIGSLSGLMTGYGALLAGKLALLVALGWFGHRHRRSLLPGLAAGGAGWAPFARLAAVEVAVMGAAIGLGVALSRTPTPVPDAPEQEVSAAEAFLGYPVPPPLTPSRWLTEFRPDLLWLIVGVLLIVGYLAGVRALRRRGDRWSVGRTIVFVLGCVLLLWATNSGPAAYGRVLFSAHMVGHMVLSMLVPVLLVLGAPVTLAMRALPARHDDSRGPREWLMVLVHSRLLRFLGHPLVAAVLFAGSLIVFYYTPVLQLALSTHVGHVLMTAHFLGVGYLFASVLVGVDPGPPRPPHLLRLVLLFATLGFHAFFGVTMLSGTELLAPDWFGQFQLGWGRPPLSDQQFGGGVAWGLGELPTILLTLVVAVQWSRDDARTSQREDRRADRDGDAELAAYNERLRGMGRGRD